VAPDPQTPLGFGKHNHAKCVADALALADTRCAERGLRLTPVRRKVLELLLQEHRALGAYAILDLLRKEGFASQPPVAYRALEFLSENGFVHKIERLNAFIACHHPEEGHLPVFMICRVCDTVAETHSGPADKALISAASAEGFQIEHTVVEAKGVCPTCAKSASA